jgi:hypothetical protein
MTAKEKQHMKDIELPLWIRKEPGHSERSGDAVGHSERIRETPAPKKNPRPGHSERSAEGAKPRNPRLHGLNAIFTLARLALILAPMTMKA